MSSISKPNRRKEIKEKESLQAQFQLNIANTNKTIASWLGGSEGSNGDKDNEEFTNTNKSFFELPIIQNGSGLSSIEQGGLKISDFVNSESDLLKLKTPAKEAATTNGSSKAMTALKNSLRNNARNKIQQKAKDGASAKSQNFKQALKAKPGAAKAPNSKTGGDEEEDEDISALRGRSAKKAVVPFGIKKKGRPF